ncbi:MAG: hypothetical protein E6Q85_02725 [Thiothrix sp.]|nr:MAG: hypothetical protein E6Q85_02725 [Thiothrix sp.]
MPQVSVSEAARLAGISRSHLYKNYIKQGLISVVRNHQGHPQIDVSELLRVFGEIQKNTALSSKTQVEDRSEIQVRTPKIQLKTQENTTETQVQIQVAALESELKLLREQLTKADEREQFYQQQLKGLTQTIKLLEHHPEPPPRRWWQWWR